MENGRVIASPQIPQPAQTFGIEHIDGLYRYALMLTRNQAEAEDLVQETYVRSLEAFRRLRQDSNVKGWLFTILRNVWLNQLRRRRTGPLFVEFDADPRLAEGLVGSLPDAHDLLESEEDAERVRAAIEKLPIEFSEIILLREFEELSYHEIAIVLNCPPGTVMSRLGRARSKLRVLLAEKKKGPCQSRKVERHEKLLRIP